MMNRPGVQARSRQRHLDGLRCIAVLMVMAYHSGVPGLAVGGFYGVDVFFVLSGFLITSLLLSEQAARGTIRLGAFWARRARRLLPGLLVMLAAVAVYVRVATPPGWYPGFRSDALSVLAYVSNWHFIAAASNYFAATGRPSLLTHTWSLAIEEQFYLVWPVLVWVLARLARRWGRRPADAVLVVSSAGLTASTGWMAYLYLHGASPSRLYYGTDTHALSILTGAALAALWARRAGTRYLPGWCSAAGLAAGTAILVWAATSMGSNDALAYEGGFLGVAAGAALILYHLSSVPRGFAARLLSVGPLVYIGRISYGMYLWYFPLFAVIDGASTGLSGLPLFGVRAAVDVAVAAVSFHLIEQPVRSGSWARLNRPGLRGVPRPAALAAFSVVGVVALVSFAVPPVVTAPAAAAIPTAPLRTGTTRVLVTGDSTGLTLGLALGLGDVEKRYGLVVDDAAQLGCGVALSRQIDSHGQAVTPAAPCDLATPPSGQWPALLRKEVARFHPDVVLVAAGRWEVQSRRDGDGGPWTDITQASDANYVQGQLDLASSIAIQAGARVGLVTAPCFASGEQPDGRAWPEDSSARLQDYNRLVAAVAAAQRGSAFVVGMDAIVCPGGRFHQSLGGVTVRAPDGIHYPFFSLSAPDRSDPDTLAQVETFGNWAAARIEPQLVR